MRISNNMMVYNFLTSLNTSQNYINRIQEQLSDGKLIHRPSDDPIRAFRSLRFNVDLTMNDQYTQNAKDASQWLNQTDSALDNLNQVMQSAKENTIKAISANPQVAQQAIGQTIDGLINQAVSIANSQIGERYIFAGQQDKVSGGPFERMTLDIGGVKKEVVVYKGDLNKISMPIQSGPADPSKDSINVTGEEAFGPLTQVTDSSGKTYQVAGLFSDLLDLKNNLTDGAAAINAPAGGAATVNGLYTGTAKATYQVKVTSVSAPTGTPPTVQITGADYSTDGGVTWTAGATTAGKPSVVTLSNGLSISIGAQAGNDVNDIYSFQAASTMGASPDLDWLSNQAMTNIDKNTDRVLIAQTNIGTRMASYEMAQNMMLRDGATIQENASANDDVDIARLTIDFKNYQNVYNAALAVGSKVMPASLADYLK